ncbi:hypothetical protein BKA66DRAFT_473097 [Pyrenochaeta sp. MPI-SDFR-AT-0127]|nr:hypothetical protein BKA66DRAFT_473097 [Pyrenochaeta sp. MPI-SDFR-AT-0127]
MPPFSPELPWVPASFSERGGYDFIDSTSTLHTQSQDALWSTSSTFTPDDSSFGSRTPESQPQSTTPPARSESLFLPINRAVPTYVCTEYGCFRRFVEQKQYKSHMKTHKLFACDVPGCNEKYRHLKSLHEHTQTKHEGRRYFCDVKGCNRSMAQKKNLMRHKALKHKELSSTTLFPVAQQLNN